MLTFVSTRSFRAFLCAAVATMALAATSQANEDMSADAPGGAEEIEIAPPNSSDEGPRPRNSGAAPEGEPAGKSERVRPSSSTRSSGNDEASKQAAREAAKRALFGDPKKGAEKPNPYLDVRGPDYYDRRAKDLLQSDGNTGKVELHPLMEAHPDSYVVVCTAGCGKGRGAGIVSMLPKPASARTPAPETGGNVVSCVAGCGADGTVAMASTPDAPANAATVGEWMTTVAKVPAGAEAPAPKAAASGDWMDKINQDRAQQKAAAPAGETPKTADAPKTVEAPKSARPLDPPSPVAAATKPSSPPPAPAAVVTAEAKPVPAATAVDAKPAAADKGETKPAPAPAPGADSKPAPGAKAVAAAEPKSTGPAPSTPIIVAGEAQPAQAAAKAAAPDAKPAPAATQMAALETPKAPAAASATKPAAAATPAPNGALFKDSAKMSSPAPAPAPAAAVESKPATPSAAEAKPAAGSTSLFKESAKVAVAAPEGKPVPAPAATAEPAPASETASKSKDETKVAAVTPPAVEKPTPAIPAKPKEGVISVLSEDKDMNAAIQKARGSLSSFWKSYDALSAGETDHALKVAVAGNGTTEHFWLTRIKREGGKISGVISNQPQSVKTVKVGQRYEFTEDMISDWTFKRNGKLVGNETMRVLLPRMPEEQASVYRKMYETP